ncbi:hypothetical protein ASPZODRAFT_99879 [Penicilliopsis zonata CBS 506.65]|uniref:Myb-like domain-containing protein n=1 Tax=Penicilliopsis zonata CBS 506.65 TaxID=1073090 RepID=A0A1L9SCN7_9EURO|nr:hypothetical protein ASPZODRAFT_99879 [Penicilliopsis zonata CBS 506.65]OJJ44889.1 hypothetical protein ASPZODRAFT_99879 [Penicilliopsis zonata CBS 506.65]
MSSSSLYEPSEDEEPSDSDHQVENKNDGFLGSSGLIQKSRVSSPPSRDDQAVSTLVPRARLGTRSEALAYLSARLAWASRGSYTKLLEEQIREKSLKSSSASGEKHNVTQNGVVIWSGREKELFFQALSRKGKNDIKAIADTIGTKTELEVQDHIRLLHRGLELQHLADRHHRTIVLGDVPAALEVSKECCEALDEYAELLCLEEQNSDRLSAQRQHQDFWVIDREKAKELEEQLKDREDDVSTACPSIFLTASLLNIEKWIRMSERFFMNPGGARLNDNWVNVAFEDESPSMTAGAFSDFYALTVSITRRLIQSAIFFAMSRIRNMKSGGHYKANIVKIRDIKAAVDVLGMKRDRSDFWVGLARKCSLDVADLRHRKGWEPSYMSYDDVENILSGKAGRSPTGRESEVEIESEEDLRVDDQDDEDVYDDASSPESLSSPLQSSSEEAEFPADPETDHADRVDEKANAIGERVLWNLMKRGGSLRGHETAFKSEADEEDTKKALHRPLGERKTKQDLIDWRDRILYRSEWEEYGYEAFEVDEEITQNRRKRRRIEPYSHGSSPDKSGDTALEDVRDLPHSPLPSTQGQPVFSLKAEQETEGSDAESGGIGSGNSNSNRASMGMDIDNEPTLWPGIKPTETPNQPKYSTMSEDISPSPTSASASASASCIENLDSKRDSSDPLSAEDQDGGVPLLYRNN